MRLKVLLASGRVARRISTVAAVVIALTAPATVRAQQKISIPSVTPTSLSALLRHEAPATAVSGELYLPPKATGPVPALVLMHGLGGLAGPTGTNIRKWAGTFASWGVAAFVVDSFGPRGLTSIANDPSKLSSWAPVADALSALQTLAADPRIDNSRIGIVGWSGGGRAAFLTALDTVRKSVIKDERKFALHVTFYGPADLQYRDRATDQSPMLFLHGEADDFTPIGPTREFADWAQSKGSAVTFITYPKTYHDFDVQGGPQGLQKNLEVGAKCDTVIEVPTGRILRMNHAENPTATVADLRPYFGSCISHGANLGFNAAARANASEKIHDFLKQYFQIAG
jgi:dienelactone hydrolase